ncbi:MAG TPA: hypothetical protein VLZ81_04095 [Blastocatellia bacterium]|nr:hypothetical protein [Blastocatellia bacterium]
MRESITPENAVTMLLTEVPAFAEDWKRGQAMSSESPELRYLVFGDFGFFINGLTNRIEETATRKSLAQSFALLNEMGQSSSLEVANLAQVGVFEVLSDSKASVRVARELLTGKALDLFERTVRNWRE